MARTNSPQRSSRVCGLSPEGLTPAILRSPAGRQPDLIRAAELRPAPPIDRGRQRLVRAEDDRGLGDHLCVARARRDNSGLDHVGLGWPAGARVDQVVRRPAGIARPSMNAGARGGDAEAGTPRAATADAERSDSRVCIARVGNTNEPLGVRAGVDRDIAIGVDCGARPARQQVRGAIRDPALGEAVEVEACVLRTLDDRRPAARRDRPRPLPEVDVCPARAARPPIARRAVSGEPLLRYAAQRLPPSGGSQPASVAPRRAGHGWRSAARGLKRR